MDPITDEWLDYPGKLQPDHFLPVALFPELLWGYDLLSDLGKRQVILDPVNIQALPAFHNRRKGSKLPSEWEWTVDENGVEMRVSRTWREEAQKYEFLIWEHLQAQVLELLAESEIREPAEDPPEWPYRPRTRTEP